MLNQISIFEYTNKHVIQKHAYSMIQGKNLFQILFEDPLKNTREASVLFKNKFRASKNRANTCGGYELMGVAMGFGKGETSSTS